MCSTLDNLLEGARASTITEPVTTATWIETKRPLTVIFLRHYTFVTSGWAANALSGLVV
jgi:hypothetical protein